MCIEKWEGAGMEMRGVALQAPGGSGHFSWIMTLIILHLKERARKEIKLMVFNSIIPPEF